MNAKIKYWLLATRPKTLPAGLVPVLLGSSLAFESGKLRIWLAILTLICSVILQIIANFVNEIYDYEKGADTEERLGPQRMVASGLISIEEMKKGVLFASCAALLLGTAIVIMSSLWILLVGIICLAFAWMYTGGPYPLAYHGYGDLLVFVFFGIVAVNFSYFVQTLYLSPTVLLASIAPGLLSMNILGINNFRDIETDRKAGKMTLSLRLGHDNCIILYQALLFGAFCVPILLSVVQKSWWNLLPLLALPYGYILTRRMEIFHGKELNEVLAGSGKLVFIHGILSCLGFIFTRVF